METTLSCVVMYVLNQVYFVLKMFVSCVCVDRIMQAEGRGSQGAGSEGRGSPVASYGSVGASYGSSRAESSLSDGGSSGGRGDRPPSSYGSMKSDDALDDDLDDPQDFKPPPSVVVTVSTRR